MRARLWVEQWCRQCRRSFRGASRSSAPKFSHVRRGRNGGRLACGFASGAGSASDRPAAPSSSSSAPCSPPNRCCRSCCILHSGSCPGSNSDAELRVITCELCCAAVCRGDYHRGNNCGLAPRTTPLQQAPAAVWCGKSLLVCRGAAASARFQEKQVLRLTIYPQCAPRQVSESWWTMAGLVRNTSHVNDTAETESSMKCAPRRSRRREAGRR